MLALYYNLIITSIDIQLVKQKSSHDYSSETSHQSFSIQFLLLVHTIHKRPFKASKSNLLKYNKNNIKK